MYFLGIDGGGTKTTFTLIDEKGKVVFSITKGTCHFNQIGFQNLEILLRDGLEEIVIGAKINKIDIIHSYLGLAGYGKVKEARVKIEKSADNAFVGLNYTLDTDIRVAIAGALKAQDGINIIAGTGSIGIAINNEKISICGGWGGSVGDEGSAFWIGKKAIQAFSKESDGRIKKGPLHRIFMEKLLLCNQNDIISYLNEDIKNDRGEIAKLATLCSMAALQGDKEAISIFSEAGKELSQVIKVLLENFDNERVIVSYTGGVFKAGELILNTIKEEIKNCNAELIEPVLAPHLGACLLAYIKAGKVVTNDLINVMKEYE